MVPETKANFGPCIADQGSRTMRTGERDSGATPNLAWPCRWLNRAWKSFMAIERLKRYGDAWTSEPRYWQRSSG